MNIIKKLVTLSILFLTGWLCFAAAETLVSNRPAPVNLEPTVMSEVTPVSTPITVEAVAPETHFISQVAQPVAAPVVAPAAEAPAPQPTPEPTLAPQEQAPEPTPAPAATPAPAPEIKSFDQLPTVAPAPVETPAPTEMTPEQTPAPAEAAPQPAPAPEVKPVEPEKPKEPVELVPEKKPEEQIAPMTIKDKEAIMQKFDEIINRLMTLENLVIQQKMAEDPSGDSEFVIDEEEDDQDIL